MIPQCVVFDLDGTLAQSKSAMTARMGFLVASLLGKTKVAIISGGTYAQFTTQFLGSLPPGALLGNLFLLPTSGAAFYRNGQGGWELVYEVRLTDKEEDAIERALTQAVEESGIALPEHSYGPRFERRGTQASFSAIGQKAPVEEKRVWDPDQKKRRAIIEKLAPKLPSMHVRMGGMTTIDITREGVDKAYGVRRLSEIAGIPIPDMLYIGDALYPGGNDEDVLPTGIPTRAVENPAETESTIESLLAEA